MSFLNTGLVFLLLLSALSLAQVDSPSKQANAPKSSHHKAKLTNPQSSPQASVNLEEAKKPEVKPQQTPSSQKSDLPTNNDSNHALLGLIINGVLSHAAGGRGTPVSAFLLEPFVDARTVSAFLSISRQEVLRMTREGKIRGYPYRGRLRHVYRYRLSEVSEDFAALAHPPEVQSRKQPL